ncbi:MAG: hypothetical protein M1837_001874 [Sclerophora amabilis]|nr:MAG: hypothetical protein M1837_001874 [Sclerophora amabilis]
MEDSNLVLTIRANNEFTARLLQHPNNKDYYLPPSWDADPGNPKPESNASSCVEDDDVRKSVSRIELGFDRRPKDPCGWLFSRKSASCDVVLDDRYVYDQHFYVRFDEKGRLILMDLSSHEMSVMYDTQLCKASGSTWILFPDFHIFVKVGPRIAFEIKLATHDTCQDDYQAKVQKFLNGSGSAKLYPAEMSSLPQIQDGNPETTAAPTRPVTPSSNGCYVRLGRLGSGTYGEVFLVLNLNTGEEYAGKEFFGGFEPTTELDILRGIEHVRFLKSTDIDLSLTGN